MELTSVEVIRQILGMGIPLFPEQGTEIVPVRENGKYTPSGNYTPTEASMLCADYTAESLISLQHLDEGTRLVAAGDFNRGRIKLDNYVPILPGREHPLKLLFGGMISGNKSYVELGFPLRLSLSGGRELRGDIFSLLFLNEPRGSPYRMLKVSSQVRHMGDVPHINFETRGLFGYDVGHIGYDCGVPPYSPHSAKNPDLYVKEFIERFWHLASNDGSFRSFNQ